MAPHRKAQMEMIGIALVVVFVVFALLFFLATSIKEPKKAQEQFSRAQLAKSLLNAMVNTRTACSNLDMTTVLEDCAGLERLECGADDAELTSCGLLLRDIPLLLEAMIPEGGYRWKVMSGSPGGSGSVIKELETSRGCETRRNVEQANQPMPLRGGTVTMVLEVCSE